MSDSLKSALLQNNTQVPRYTSYPPANFFSKDPDSALYFSWLDQLAPNQPLSLYLHIPFCPKMCWFCGCHTRATAHYEPVRDYLGLLRMEIQKIAAQIGKTRPVRHIHFGGGSPTILSPDDFSALMHTLRAAFTIAPDAQIAIEIDPRQTTPQKIDAYIQNGVRRISIGVQDIHDVVMNAINRHQPFEVVARAIETCRAQGVNHINIDLVYGLPHQTLPLIHETIEKVLSLSPDRLALFGYAHVPWMKRHMRLIKSEDLPNSAARYDLFTAACTQIEQNGYIPIGIDHFARPQDDLALCARAGTLGRNFQGYIPVHEKMPIIGLGVSAISSLPQGYIQNTPDAPHYRDEIEAGRLPLSRYHSLTLDDQIRARVIEHLMCQSRVNLTAVAAEFGIDPSYFTPDLNNLTPLIETGLAARDEGWIISAPHRLAVRLCASAFDAYRVPETTTRHSVAV